jgi:lysophospholipase L1-like esterase
MSSTAMVLFAGIAAACSGGPESGCTAPAVSTGAATSITSKSATMNGTVNPQGCETTYVFEYGPSSGGYPDSIESFAGKGTSPKSVSATTLPLQPSTSYHFRLSATNEGGTTKGGSTPFTTPAACSKPTVTTEAASFITSDKAFLNGKINPFGCSASYTFEYGLAGSGTLTKLTGSISGLGPFSVFKEASGLQANKLYTFRLSASTSEGGKTDGSFLNFTTKPKYVALGDSYSAGTGTGTSYEPGNSGTCHRTTRAYPYLLHNAHPDWGYASVTCEGAETTELINSQAKNLTKDTTWVTYTVGGNDAGFHDVLTVCAPLETVNCTAVLATEEGFIQKTLPIRLDEVNNKIKAEAPSAKVIVLAYPHIFNGEDCNTLTFFDAGEMGKMNALVDLVDKKLSEAATRAGPNFKFTDVRTEFNGHAVCDPPGIGTGEEWINGLSTPVNESYHPKIIGHEKGYFKVVKAVTG